MVVFLFMQPLNLAANTFSPKTSYDKRRQLVAARLYWFTHGGAAGYRPRVQKVIVRPSTSLDYLAVLCVYALKNSHK